MENSNNKKLELEQKQKELAEWIEDKNENVSNKLSKKVKEKKKELIASYIEVAKKQLDASSSKFSKRSVKDERKEYSKEKKKLRILMKNAHLDGRTGRLPKDEQFEKMEKNIEESVNIEKEIMKINKNEALFRRVSDQDAEELNPSLVKLASVRGRASGQNTEELNIMSNNFRSLTEPTKSPFYEKTKIHTLEWVKNFSLLDFSDNKVSEKFERLDASLLACLLQPSAELNSVKLLNELLVWLFIFDDTIDDYDCLLINQIKNEVINIQENKKINYSVDNLHFNSLLKAYRDWFSRFRKLASEGCQRRLTNHIKDYLEACLQEAQFKANEEYPTVEEYFNFRRNVGGAFPCFDLIEIAKKIPDGELKDKRVNTSMNYANNNIVLINDIVSLKRERAKGGEVSNYVLVLEKHRNWSEVKAKKFVNYLIEKELKEFEEIRQELLEELSIDSSKKYIWQYVESLVDWMTGHIEWCKNTGRQQEQVIQKTQIQSPPKALH